MPFRALLYRLYWKAESVIVPGLKSSQHWYYEKLRKVVAGKVWLDLGCGHQVFGDWMTKEEAELIASSAKVCGIDLDWEGLKQHAALPDKVVGDLTALPVKSDSADVVSANMVVEHLSAPEAALSEIYRVLRPNGKFVFHTPNYDAFAIRVASHTPDWLKKRLIWFLERRREKDVFPTYYRMNTQCSIRQFAAKANFFVEEIVPVSTSASTVMLGPVAWGELLYLRLLEQPTFAHFRSNLIVTLRKIC